MYGVQTKARYGSRYVSLGPYYFPASPGWERDLQPETVAGILQSLTTLRVRAFTWNVRYDQKLLADRLASSGLAFTRPPNQVLELQDDYERVAAGYNATTRNHVRKAHRRGVLLRDGTPEDVESYYRMHLQLVQEKAGTQPYRIVYPIAFLRSLAEMRSEVRFILAECDGQLASGGLFLRDGSAVLYFHGASDRAYSDRYPASAVLDEAIRWACACRATSFNFLGSGGIVSLAQFKSSWGARDVQDWCFRWQSPLWDGLAKLRSRLMKWSKRGG